MFYLSPHTKTEVSVDWVEQKWKPKPDETPPMVIINDGEFNQILLFAHPGKDFSLFTNKNTVNLNNFLCCWWPFAKWICGRVSQSNGNTEKNCGKVKKAKMSTFAKQEESRSEKQSALSVRYTTTQKTLVCLDLIYCSMCCNVQTFYTFYTLCKSSSAACSHAPSSCSPQRRLLAHLQMIPKRRRRDQKTDNRKKGLTKAREGEQDSPLVSDAPLTLNPHRAPTHRQTAGRKRD